MSKKQTYEIGFSSVTGDYFVISHDGYEFHGDYHTEEEAKDKVELLEARESVRHGSDPNE